MAVFYDLTTRCPWSPSYTTSLDFSLIDTLGGRGVVTVER
jgi:hypothetical protein